MIGESAGVSKFDLTSSLAKSKPEPSNFKRDYFSSSGESGYSDLINDSSSNYGSEQLSRKQYFRITRNTIYSPTGCNEFDVLNLLSYPKLPTWRIFVESSFTAGLLCTRP